MSVPSRTRNWSFIVYPDSAPSNWVELLDQEHIAAFISPLHDQDINDDASDHFTKKAHYHVIIMFDNVKNEEQAQAISNLASGVKVIKVNSIRGCCRYLCHLDNPEKYRYDINDVISLGGADYISQISTCSDDDAELQEVFAFIRANQIVYFNRFIDWCISEKPEWFRLLRRTGFYLVKEYMKSFDYDLRGSSE